MPESFGGLSEELATNAATLAEWREWACSSEPENTALPGQWNTQLNSFQKMVSFVCFSKKKKWCFGCSLPLQKYSYIYSSNLYIYFIVFIGLLFFFFYFFWKHMFSEKCCFGSVSTKIQKYL